MDENDVLKIFWVLFAQLGVKIDYIQDNKAVIYSVPSMSDYVSAENIMIAGEDLIIMVNKFFEEYGMHPEPRIRSEYWTRMMGEAAVIQIQEGMGEIE